MLELYDPTKDVRREELKEHADGRRVTITRARDDDDDDADEQEELDEDAKKSRAQAMLENLQKQSAALERGKQRGYTAHDPSSVTFEALDCPMETAKRFLTGKSAN